MRNMRQPEKSSETWENSGRVWLTYTLTPPTPPRRLLLSLADPTQCQSQSLLDVANRRST